MEVSQNSARARVFTELRVYREAFDHAMAVFELSKRFPACERYSLTDQLRRSTRSVCSNSAEVWAKRKYPAAFASKLVDALSETEETIVWIDFSQACGYLPESHSQRLREAYRIIAARLVVMIHSPERWRV